MYFSCLAFSDLFFFKLKIFINSYILQDSSIPLFLFPNNVFSIKINSRQMVQ